MRNVLLIIQDDARSLFRNVMSVIITIGLVALPSLFTWYNTLACWDVFENTGKLPIAVANEDEGYTSDLFPIAVNIGEKVVSALRGNDSIKWVITDGNDATEGTMSGKYYASIVIPKDFSRQILTFYKGDAQSADIVYYVNEKKNAVSPNITGAGADEVSHQVNAAFVNAMAEIFTGIAQSTYQNAQDSGASGRIAIITGHMRSSAARMNEAADVMSSYSTLVVNSEKLISDSTQLVESARSQAKSATSGANIDKQELQNLADNLSSSLENLSGSLNLNTSSLGDLEDKINSLQNVISSDADIIATALLEKAGEIDGRANELRQIETALEKLRDDLHAAIKSRLDRITSGERVDTALRREVTETVEQMLPLNRLIADLSKTISTLDQISETLKETADALKSGTMGSGEKTELLRKAISDAKADFAALKAQLEEDLTPHADTLKSDLQVLAADLEGAATYLESLGSDLPAVATELQSALNNASNKVNDAGAKLRSAAQSIQELADKIDAAVAAGDSETLRSLMQSSPEDLAAAFTAPVQIERNALFPVKDFGSAMAPLYSALALFIGSLLIMVAVKPEVSERGRSQLRNPKPRHLFFGRFGVVALLSLMQTTLLGLGNMLFMQVQVTEPLLYMVCFWASGLIFAFMIYTMVVAFGNLGKGIAVLLLIVQVTACGGSYPLPIMPDFVQALSPWAPATHVVDALRAAMFGLYQNDFWVSMGKLALFIIPFLLLGLALRKPLEGFMRFYVSKVEESKIME